MRTERAAGVLGEFVRVFREVRVVGDFFENAGEIANGDPFGEEVLLRVADERGGPEVQAERGELEAALHRAIAELPEERRVVIILRDLEGLSYEEIARALDLEPGTVRSRIHRARMDLRGKLERFLP